MHDILYALLRTTLFLTICGGVCCLALRKIEPRLPRLSRFLWLAVLLTGWIWLQPAIRIESPHLAGTPAPVVATPSQPFDPFTATEPRHEVDAFSPPSQFPSVKTDQTTTIAERKPFEWNSLIFKTVFAVWLGGIIITIFFAAIGYVRILLLLRNTVTAGDALSKPWKVLLTEHGINEEKIPMVLSKNLGPALIRTVYGYRLVVPRELWSELSEAGRSGILKHEREHFRRRDVWKSFFVRILALPHWFNPMAHLAVHRFEEAAEVLCDRAAFSGQREEISEFARILLLLHENAPTHFVARQSIFGRGLKHRVACLLHENQFAKGVSTMRKILLITGAVALFAACLFRVEFIEQTVAQTPPKEPGTKRSAVPGLPEPEKKIEHPETTASRPSLPDRVNLLPADNELWKNVVELKKKQEVADKLYEQKAISVEEQYKVHQELLQAWAAYSAAVEKNEQKDPEKLAALSKNLDESRRNYLDVRAKYVAGQKGGTTGDHADAQLKLTDAEVALYRFTGEKDRLLAALQTRVDAARERAKWSVTAVKAGLKPASDTSEAEKKHVDAEAELKSAQKTLHGPPRKLGADAQPLADASGSVATDDDYRREMDEYHKIIRETNIKILERRLVESNKEVEAVRKAFEEKRTTADQVADAERRNRELVEELNTYKQEKSFVKE